LRGFLCTSKSCNKASKSRFSASKYGENYGEKRAKKHGEKEISGNKSGGT
jgi:hypothetical protein